MQTQVMMIARSERLCTHLDKRRSHGDGRTHSAHRRAHRKASRREGSSGREEGQEELSEHDFFELFGHCVVGRRDRAAPSLMEDWKQPTIALSIQLSGVFK